MQIIVHSRETAGRVSKDIHDRPRLLPMTVRVQCRQQSMWSSLRALVFITSNLLPSSKKGSCLPSSLSVVNWLLGSRVDTVQMCQKCNKHFFAMIPNYKGVVYESESIPRLTESGLKCRLLMFIHIKMAPTWFNGLHSICSKKWPSHRRYVVVGTWRKSAVISAGKNYFIISMAEEKHCSTDIVNKVTFCSLYCSSSVRHIENIVANDFVIS